MLLSAITLLPLLFGLALLVVPRTWVKPFALILSLFEFALSVALLVKFDKSIAGLQFVEQMQWIPDLGITYFLGIDGISLWLVLLATFMMPITILSSWNSVNDRSGNSLKGYHFCLFFLQTAMIGSFLAMDAILFYTFFELALIPMFLMIGVWGGPKRRFASVKFFVYTMFGSLMMLIAIIYLMFVARETIGGMTSNLVVLYQLKTPFVAGTLMNPQMLLFLAFSLAFAIKAALFPFHTWLPDAYSEAPTPGTNVMAGVMLKMGSYGFLRLVIPLFPEAAEHFAWVFLFLGVISVLYGALVSMVQPDLKKLAGYSSISHMGYVMIGLFALNTYGVTGSLFLMISHGVYSAALFILIGIMIDRFGTREIPRFGGLAKALPVYTIFFVIVTMASIAVPMTNGFVGEFLIMLGTFQANLPAGVGSVFGVVFGAVAMLWMVKRVFFGEATELVRNPLAPLKDLNWREIGVLTPLVILIFWMGLCPNFFIDYSKASLDNWVTNKDSYQVLFDDSKTDAKALKAPAPGAEKQ